MNGIDTAAALLANPLSALAPVGAQGSAGASQADVSALAGRAANLSQPPGSTAPQASAQTELSAVALALDAIIRTGGEATPAVLGRAPLWPGAGAGPAGAPWAPPALPGPFGAAVLTDAAAALLAADVAALAAGLADGADAATPSGAGAAGAADAAGAAATAQTAAPQTGVPAALAAALQQTVAGSGLFYESHLAQWLLGRRTLASLMDEPQNRLVAAEPGEPADAAELADDLSWAAATSPGAPAAAHGARAGAAASPAPRYAGAGLALLADAESAAWEQGNAASAGAPPLPAGAPEAGNPGTAAPVHAAVIPLVRQQLDLLATGEFRWTGEAWAGARLDWTVKPDRYDTRDARGGHGGASADHVSWHTRLTLSLPSLGTVDAELTLAGATLAVRVQASPGGAARLAAHGDALARRLTALGLAVAGLSIRESGGGVPGAAAAGRAAHAADTWARARDRDLDDGAPR